MKTPLLISTIALAALFSNCMTKEIEAKPKATESQYDTTEATATTYQTAQEREIADIKREIAVTKERKLALEKEVQALLKERRDDQIEAMKTLCLNNSIAVRAMVWDNAFTSLAYLLSETVSQSPHIVRAIYMTTKRVAWINVTPQMPSGIGTTTAPLDDELSRWCQNSASANEVVISNSFRDSKLHATGQLVEYCIPVIDGDEKIYGYLRYTVVLD